MNLGRSEEFLNKELLIQEVGKKFSYININPRDEQQVLRCRDLYLIKLQEVFLDRNLM